MKINVSTIATTLSILMLMACNQKNESISKNETSVDVQNKGHELVLKMINKVGSYTELFDKHDVVYTYTYLTPEGKKDVSTEKYIFDGELSYGAYKVHERSLTDLNGTIEQGYDGNSYWLRHEGKLVNNEKYLKRVAFNRPTNFYWFTMMQKLADPGLIYNYIGEPTVGSDNYDIVKVSFESTDDKPTDIYQLYINKETALVDQFLFTVADFGVMETPFLMKLEYEKVDGILIPSQRQYKKSTWNGDVSQEPWINVTWSDIKFNNNLSKEIFKPKDMKTIANTKSPLKEKLDKKKADFELKADAKKKSIYKDGIEAVVKSGIVESAKQVGDIAPDFVLKNAVGKTVSLQDYLGKGKVILTWYRGGWCPYCNLTLHELQQELDNFKEAGANLLALTPELPDKSISTAEKNDLQFEVLSDLGNKVAKSYGIVFKLTDEVAEIYNNAFDMNGYNGDTSNELPLAATYIIGEDGKILYSFLDADYRNRAEPSELLAFLKENK